jgi:hypothetical protein
MPDSRCQRKMSGVYFFLGSVDISVDCKCIRLIAKSLISREIPKYQHGLILDLADGIEFVEVVAGDDFTNCTRRATDH